MKKTEKYYAYKNLDTNKEAVVDNWQDCQKKINGKNCRYKKFDSKNAAEKWLKEGANYIFNKNKKPKIKVENYILKEGIYFDAGTGRGRGVEVRITDKNKNPLLKKILKNEKINEFENYELGKGKTNNFGELSALYLALNLAINEEQKNIFGDSKLVIDYWSKGIIKNEVAQETKDLAKKVKILRDEFEKKGGKIEHISGDINPADLGFHK